VVGVAFATVVATAAVVGVAVALGAAAACARRGLAVVGVGAGRALVAAAGVVVVTVVGGSIDVVVSSTAVVDVVGTSPVALLDRRMAGSLLPWGTPAMATPTAAHITSISAVIKRCPGLTA
jgi:hypothetical protein